MKAVTELLLLGLVFVLTNSKTVETFPLGLSELSNFKAAILDTDHQADTAENTRNKRFLWDLFSYFYDYDDEDEDDDQNKYLICRNCTVHVNQSLAPVATTTTSTTTTTTTTTTTRSTATTMAASMPTRPQMAGPMPTAAGAMPTTKK
ncbi:sestrin homolog [Teleopsis dalmanni]|uniref:sestrin homolog n=1 Tax=Teleopsis dalmanni TaxID=139649 RepID=UPI0018CDEB27|nr:sestrin homolog [Teleopsis dalmanni]